MGLSLGNSPPFLQRVFSVSCAVCWHAIGEELLEQIGIVLLGYIWVAPIKLLVIERSADRNKRCVLDPIDEGNLPTWQTVILTKVDRCGPCVQPKLFVANGALTICLAELATLLFEPKHLRGHCETR